MNDSSASDEDSTFFSESDVEDVTLSWLKGLGWRVAHGPKTALETLVAAPSHGSAFSLESPLPHNYHG